MTNFENTQTSKIYNPAVILNGSASNGSISIKGSQDSLAQAANAVITLSSDKSSGNITMSTGGVNVKSTVFDTDTSTYSVDASSSYTVTSPSIKFIREYQEESGGEIKTQTYNIEDFALKTDIPAGVDLTNYQGDWSLTKQKTYSTSSYTANAYLSIKTKDFNNNLIGCDISTAISTTDDGNADLCTGIRILSTGFPTMYYVEGGDIDDAMEPDFQGSYYISQPLGILVKTLSYEASIDFSNGITFKDTQIQQHTFTLKSLVDRIADLETYVSELQTQLATKADTSTPTFTGPVTINKV